MIIIFKTTKYALAGCVLALILVCAPVNRLYAEIIISGEQTELILEAKIQYDAIPINDCEPEICEFEDGLRVFDLSARYNDFVSLGLLNFAEINLDLTDDVNSGLFSDTLGVNEESPESDTVDRAIIGAEMEEFEISFGRQFPISRDFGPTSSSFINFDLSAFDDDRLLVSSGKADNFVTRFDWRDLYLVSASAGLTENSSDIPNLNYDVFIDGPLPVFEGIYFSFAAKSSSIDGGDDFTATGAKLSWFRNNGNLFELAISNNRLGNYAEFSFRREWAHRHSLEFGVSFFEEDLGNDTEKLDTIVDSRFFYVNLAFSMSRTLQFFIENSDFQSDNLDSSAILLGLGLSI